MNQLFLKDVEELISEVEKFVRDNMDWCAAIGDRVLSRKGITFTEYFEELITCAIPPDKIALYIVAHIYKRHIGVMIGYEYWSTLKQSSFKKCDVKLLYLGNLKFLSTVAGNISASDDFYVHTLIHDLAHAHTEKMKAAQRTAQAIEYAKKEKLEREKREQQLKDAEAGKNDDTMHGKENTMQPNKHDTKQPKKNDTKQPKKNDTKQPKKSDTKKPKKTDTKQPNKKTFETKQVGDKHRGPKVKPIGKRLFQDNESTSSYEDKNNAGDEDYVPPDGSVSRKRKRGVALRTRSAKKDKKDADESIEESEQENVKPKKRKRSQSSQQKVESRRSGRLAKRAKQAVNKAKSVQSKKGAFQVAVHGIPKRPKKPKKDIKCPLCSEKFQSVRQGNLHLQRDHKGTKIQCNECDAEFLTFNARVKHMAKHRELKFICSTCGRHFPFENQLIEHERKHGKKGTGKIRCEVVSCPKQFCSKRAMKFHLKSHSDNLPRVNCDLCPKDFANKGLLQQHRRGSHGTELGLSFKTHCKVEFPNPGRRDRHQHKCDECQRIIAQKFNAEFVAQHDDSSDSE